jgi:uncharacterized protein YbcV (DUF1398 family)
MSIEKKILGAVTAGAIAAASLTGHKANAKSFESPDNKSKIEESYRNRKIGPSQFEHFSEVALDVYMKLSEIINSRMLEFADIEIFQDTPEYKKLLESNDDEIITKLIEQLAKGDTKYQANREFIFEAAKEFYATTNKINTIFESSGGDEAFFKYLFDKARDFDKVALEGVKELNELKALTNKLVGFFPKRIFVGGLPVSTFGHFKGRTVDKTILKILANFVFIKKNQETGKQKAAEIFKEKA